MAEPEAPNRKSQMEKAEGDRHDERGRADGRAGVTNRADDEETASRKRVPERGGSKPGAHAG